MTKNKKIAIVIFLITICVPFNKCLLLKMTSTFSNLVFFILTVIGMFLGAYFFSKKELK